MWACGDRPDSPSGSLCSLSPSYPSASFACEYSSVPQRCPFRPICQSHPRRRFSGLLALQPKNLIISQRSEARVGFHAAMGDTSACIHLLVTFGLLLACSSSLLGLSSTVTFGRHRHVQYPSSVRHLLHLPLSHYHHGLAIATPAIDHAVVQPIGRVSHSAVFLINRITQVDHETRWEGRKLQRPDLIPATPTTR